MIEYFRMNETTNHFPNTSFPRSFQQCQLCQGSAEWRLAVLSGVLFVGVLLNVPLLRFAIGELMKGKKKPDLLLVANLAVADILPLFSCFPFELHHIILVNFFGKDVDIALLRTQRFSVFLFAYVKMLTMAATAYERYEVVTKFLHQRRLKYGSTLKILIGIWATWLLGTVTNSLVQLHYNRRNWSSCYLKDQSANKNMSYGISFILKWALTGFIITISCVTILWILPAAALHMKNHRQKMVLMFGKAGATREIRFTKVSEETQPLN